VLNDSPDPDIVATNVGHTFVPQTPEYYAHDADGNLTNDGHWTYVWDAENRLLEMVANSNVPNGAKARLVFAYDWRGRRIQKEAYDWNPSTLNYDLSTRTKFAYDGWNLSAILDSQSSILQSFLWGLDLSGTMEGAGGVGGLLAVWAASTLNNQPSTHFACYDGNGNVMALVDASDGTESARYEYGPFGEVIRATGPMAEGNPFRFSTKYADEESDLVYYGYRFHSSEMGRWLSRDPIEEQGGMNLYDFSRNAPMAQFDSDGRQVFPIRCAKCGQMSFGSHDCVASPQAPPIDGVDHLLNAGITPACHIVVFVGHNRSKEPHLPQVIRSTANCSYGTAVTCFGETVRVENQLPGIDPRPDQYTTINYADAAALAQKDFAIGVANAKRLLCGIKNCCCRKVTVRVACTGLSKLEIKPSVLGQVCGKVKVIQCP
jgi:RHS repeat-associated protein